MLVNISATTLEELHIFFLCFLVHLMKIFFNSFPFFIEFQEEFKNVFERSLGSFTFLEKDHKLYFTRSTCAPEKFIELKTTLILYKEALLTSIRYQLSSKRSTAYNISLANSITYDS